MKLLRKMSGSFLGIASEPSTKSAHDVQKTADVILSSLSNVLTASMFTGQSTSKSNGLFQFFIVSDTKSV